MTDDQFRELRTLIQNLAVEIERIKLHLKKQDEIAETRHKALMAVLVDYEMVIEGDEDSMDLVRRIFPDQN